jgi:DNA repair protein RadC
MSKKQAIEIPEDVNAGHRERLRQRFLKSGTAGVADYELLELLLFAVIPRRDVKPLAKQLLSAFGSLAGVLGAGVAELTQVRGVSENSASLIKTVHALTQRVLKEDVEKKPLLGSWQKLIDYCYVAMAHEKREHLRVLFLNRKNQLIADEVQQTGTVDHAPVYPREIVRRALELGATAMILVHNHPSGDPTPSDSDIAMTEEVIRAARTLDLVVHDHIIISKNGHVSFKSLGIVSFSG